MICEILCCHILSCVASVALFMSGFVQVFVSGIYIVPLDLVHLVFQILAGTWSMFTGVVCFLASWKNNSGAMNSVGRKVSIFLNFILEVIATALILVDEAGINISLKHYLPYFKITRAGEIDFHSKDLMFLTGSGSLSLFMGMLILISNLQRFQKKDLTEDESNVVVLSARWVFKTDTDVLLQSPNIIESNKNLEIDENSQALGNKDLENFPTYVSKISYANEFRHSENSSLDLLATTDTNLNRSTYLRFYEDEDFPVECFRSPERDTTSIMQKLRITPKRKSMKVSSPTPPNTFGNKRVLSSSLSSTSNISLKNENEGSSTAQLIRCNRLSSFRTPSYYYSCSSRIIDSELTPQSSTYQSVFSRSPDSLQQSTSSRSSLDNSSVQS